MPDYIAAIDQGTTSTRCILFDGSGPVAAHQLEHRQIYPRPGWVEHDPLEIWDRAQAVVRGAIGRAPAGATIRAVGITNQRETVVAWNRTTGRPYGNAVVWSDTRTRDLCDRYAQAGGIDQFRDRTGLPLATYFTGPKVRWLLDHVPDFARDARSGDALVGTIDTWLIWNLTGGAAHVTDVTNASRTMLMNLRTLDWDQAMLDTFGIPRSVLPVIVSSNHPDGLGVTRADGPFGRAVPIAGVLGDQQAALVGQACFEPGESKSTYGTGCFVLTHTGGRPVPSWHGLLTTVAYRFHGRPACYALEGSVAVAGSLVQWLRDNLGLIPAAPDASALAASVPDTGGVYFVPAFSGLFAPWWRSDARGTIVGLTQQTTKAHLARAVLEAVALQTRDVLDAMAADVGAPVTLLKVDGGMSASDPLMQIQADALGVPVVRSAVRETTALGAAYAAGLATGFWSDERALRAAWRADRQWEPRMTSDARRVWHATWLRAVDRAKGWLE